jgi:glycosyltransferase involved in cell wall biosynthesis
MHIGVNCYLLQKHIGGLRQYFHMLFRELLGSDQENDYIFFYYGQNREELDHLQNKRWKEGAVLLNDQREVMRHLNKLDLYFCPFNALWPRPVPLPSVMTLVDIQEKYYPQFFTKQDLLSRKYHYEGSTRAADQVITISEFSRTSIAYHHRIPIDKVHVVYLAPDESFQQPLEGNPTGLELPERYIFYPANRWFHKNHDNLLKSLRILLREFNLRVDCVLTGFDYDNGYPLQKKIGEYGLNHQIRTLGYVTQEQIKHIYHKAVLLCFPSLFEGFGMPLVEAMAVGCPVVCSNATSIPEVVGDAALCFNPLDAHDIAQKIYDVWTNPELRERLKKRGFEQARKFSAKNLAARHKNVFQLAAQSYRRTRYLYYRYLFGPVHTAKSLMSKWNP